MKKFYASLILFILISINSKSQILNTAKVLGPKNFSIGLAPAYYNHNLGLFFTVNAGLKRGIDFELILGTTGSSGYFAGNLEWSLHSSNSFKISLLTGSHVIYHNFGLDGNINFTFNIRNDINLYSGFNMQINFGDEVWTPFWLPLGTDIALNRTLHFIFEASIPLNIEAYPIIDGGIVIYF